MRAYCALMLLLLLLAACSQRQPPAEGAAPAVPPPATPATATVSAPAASAELAPSAAHSIASYYEIFAAAADTVLHLPGRTYRLSWRVRLDTLQPLTHVTPPDPTRYFAGDTSRGFQGFYVVQIRDSLGQRVGRHAFTKADFYPAVGPELAISSEVELPRLLGYSEPLGGFVFTVPFNAPGTDWYGEVALVLAPTGQVRYLGTGTGSDGPEVRVELSTDSRTLLTISEIRHAGRPPILIARAGAELRGATLLNDTLALLIYEPGQYRTRAGTMPEFEATLAQRRQSNAFVRDVRDSREVAHFRYDGFYAELGYTVPLTTVAQTVYLLDTAKGLYVLPLRQPAAGQLVPFTTLPHAASQPAAGEVSFELMGPTQQFRFFADTTQPTHVRYQLLKN